jgi:hypothetical protein
MIATLSVSLSQLAAGAFIDRVDPRAVVIGSGLVTVGYATVWRLVTRRVLSKSTVDALSS